ncbi:MAG: hypothetical protein JXR51_08010 [Bacteroidales bacterium]|nr:hypothetical protein [Bacteroidales bacterium]MBN2757105.1 hypothetical protein [Bacteroidales bacterium]
MKNPNLYLITLLLIFVISCNSNTNNNEKELENSSKIEATIGEKTVSEELQKTEPIYEEFQDESPKTGNGNFTDILKEYYEIIKGDGFTNVNPEIDRAFTEVLIKKKNGEVKMIEISESASSYSNKWQYFYKNNKLFYAYVKLEYENEQSGEMINEKRKVYFANNKCMLFLFNNSDKVKKYPEYEPKGIDILKEAYEYLQKTNNNKWNEF